MTEAELIKAIEKFCEDNKIEIAHYDNYDGEDRFIGADYYFTHGEVEVSIRRIIT